MDFTGSKVGNIVIGELKNDEIVSKLSFRSACKKMSAADHITVARLFN